MIRVHGVDIKVASVEGLTDQDGVTPVTVPLVIRTIAVLVVDEPNEMFIGFSGSTVHINGARVGVGVGATHQ